MGLLILIITLLVLLISFRFYVSPKVKHNINPSWKRSTPARRNMDGVEFIPAGAGILSGFQFRSISLDVIISPVIAVQFGWLPAILWLLFGAIFFGWVQDYLAAIISVRTAGSSISDLIGLYFTPTSRTVILVFLFCYLLIIISQFSSLVSTLLSREEVPFAILFLVIAGFFAGLMIYRWRINLFVTSFLSVLIALFGFWISSTQGAQELIGLINQRITELGSINPVYSSTPGSISWHSLLWLIILFAVCYLGAILPIWRFAVPFNYVSSWLVLFGFGLAGIGLFLGTLNGSINAVFEIPALVSTYQANLGPLWPFLFVTLSSGAISGWHSLVSTFSTSHQVEKEPLVMPVTTGAMYGETIIVVIVIIFAATFGVSAGTFSVAQGYALASGPASVFAVGIAKTWNVIGIPESVGGSFSAYLLTLMGLSVLQLVIRYARFISADLFGERFPVFKKPGLNTLFVIVIALLLVVFGLRQWLWILFAGANQLLAALVLLLASLWLIKQGKNFQWTFFPSAFLFLTGMAALLYSAFYQALFQQIIATPDISLNQILGNIITILFALLFMGTAFYLYLVGFRELFKARSIPGKANLN